MKRILLLLLLVPAVLQAQRYTQEECVDWPGWRYTPFAANIQLIFYRGREGDVLVKPLLNERETRILGLEGFPYYRWKDLKAWWLQAR